MASSWGSHQWQHLQSPARRCTHGHGPDPGRAFEFVSAHAALPWQVRTCLRIEHSLVGYSTYFRCLVLKDLLMLGYLSQVAEDARFYHRLKRPLRRATFLSVLITACSSPGLWVLASHRIGYWCFTRRHTRTAYWWLARLTYGLGRYVGNVFVKSDLLGDCQVNGPVYLSDGGYLTCGALSIGAGSIIHDHVTFGHGVGGGNRGRPRIGKRVWIGSHCIVAGELEVGDGATILPGTYVSQSVPPSAVLRGNPGRIVGRDVDNSVLCSTVALFESLPDAKD